MSIASSDGVLPNVSVAKVRANSEENKLITRGMICKIPIAITILKIVFYFHNCVLYNYTKKQYIIICLNSQK